MSVQVLLPGIMRIEPEYSGAFAEVIDNLEFDVIGPADPVDSEPPVVSIIGPLSGSLVTGETVISLVEHVAWVVAQVERP